MSVLYAALATMRAAIGFEDDDTSRDALLTQALSAASRAIDLTCGRRFSLDAEPTVRVINPRGRTLAEADGDRLLVADIGGQAVTVAVGPPGGPYTDLDPAMVELDPADAFDHGAPVTSLLYLGGRWAGRVRVTARWGWPTVPAPVAQAALIQATRLYRRKDSPDGVAGSAEWGVVRLGRRDPDVFTLIEPYVLPGLA